jgi:hypothetical protein
MIYNSNLDRSETQRRSVQDLRTELKTWERDRKVERNMVNDVDAYQVRTLRSVGHPLFSFLPTLLICTSAV